MEDFTEDDWLELQAGQYARRTCPVSVHDDKPPLLTRNQVRALIRDAYKEGRLSGHDG
jgi:hypothetical protein